MENKGPLKAWKPLEIPKDKKPAPVVGWKKLIIPSETQGLPETKIEFGHPLRAVIVKDSLGEMRTVPVIETTRKGSELQTGEIGARAMFACMAETKQEGRQDSLGFRLDSNKHVQVIALADGVGTGVLSRGVADAAVEAALDISSSTSLEGTNALDGARRIEEHIKNRSNKQQAISSIDHASVPELFKSALKDKIMKGELGSTTLMIARLERHLLRFMRIGDGAIIICNRDEIKSVLPWQETKTPAQINPFGKPLTDQDIEYGSLPFEPGDIALFCTDGLVKQVFADGQTRTIEGLAQSFALLIKQGRSFQEIMNTLLDGSEGGDDVTCVIIEQSH